MTVRGRSRYVERDEKSVMKDEGEKEKRSAGVKGRPERRERESEATADGRPAVRSASPVAVSSR